MFYDFNNKFKNNYRYANMSSNLPSIFIIIVKCIEIFDKIKPALAKRKDGSLKFP